MGRGWKRVAFDADTAPVPYPTLESCEIDKGPRGQEKPSDHTPIIVTLSDLP
jgi:exonuclease III